MHNAARRTVVAGPTAMKSSSSDLPDNIELSDDTAVKRWSEHFGVTPMQLEEAVQAVGSERSAVREHLLNQGASSGPG
jgi:hypothetical protein